MISRKQWKAFIIAIAMISGPISQAWALSTPQARPPRYGEEPRPPSGPSDDDRERENRERERQAHERAREEQERRERERWERERQERDRYERERQREEQERRERDRWERERQREEQERREREDRERRERENQPPYYPPEPPPYYPPSPEPTEPIPVQPAPAEPTPPPQEIFGCDESFGPNCAIFSFWWPKPHKVFEFNLATELQYKEAQFIRLMSVMTEGKRGRTGILGISRLVLYLSDGQVINVLEYAQQIYPDRIARNGQMYLKNEGDLMDIPIPAFPPEVSIIGMSIKADSWINPQTPALLQVWFSDQPLPLPPQKPIKVIAP